MLKSTAFSAVAIVVIGALLGLGFNVVRTDVRLKMTRNYFRIAQGEGLPCDGALSRVQPRAEPSSSANTDAQARERLLPEHPYTVVTVGKVIDMVTSEAAFNGELVIIDARNETDYREGHIPGAYHIDNYNVDKYLPELRPLLEAASTIVVYCGGGECEDSIFLATELEYQGFCRDSLRLFEAGVAAWREADMPIEQERDPFGVSELEFTDAGPENEEIGTP